MIASGRLVGIVGAALLAISLVLPVGDAPWYSFWREWTASIAVLLMVVGAVSALRDLDLPLQLHVFSLPALSVALAILCWAQYGTGLVAHLTDALLPSAYLLGFAICIVVSHSLPQSERDVLSDRVAAALLGAALVSAPLAALQWIGWLRLDLGMKVAGGRPVAHMEQANLLCSLLIQGAFGAWRLAAQRRLGARSTLLMCVPVLIALVLTQSRVAWLVAFALFCAVVLRRDVVAWRPGGRTLAGAAVLVVIGTVLLPSIDSLFNLAGASLSERTSEGRRPAIWSLFLDAATTRPWTGWGVLQNGAAQFALAVRHPSLGYYFSSAHDIVIDLMIWFGVPGGLLAGVALVLAVARRVARAPSSATLATAMSAAALLLHGLVELPLLYSYYLLPLGLMLGLTSAPANGSAPALRLRTNAPIFLPILTLAPALLLALLGREYIRVTDVRPALEIDSETRHQVLSVEQPVPDVKILDQLRDFHAFAALPLKDGLSATALEAARAAMLRTATVPSIERYALLAGINKQRTQSLDALQRVCKFEDPPACKISHRSWQIWRQRWPQLPPWSADLTTPQ